MVLSFFQSPPKLFSRITNNNQLEYAECYLLRDRRDCCPKMDYIVQYLSNHPIYDGVFEERFWFVYYKTPLETEWTKNDKFYNWVNNKKLFNLLGQIPIPKSMINNPSVDPEKIRDHILCTRVV